MRALTAALLGLAALAAAADRPEPAKEMPSKERKVRRLLEVTGAGNMGKQMLDSLMDQFKSMPGLPDDFIENFKKMADPQALTEKIVPIYMKHYEEADLDAAIAFYESPAGKRLIEGQGPVLKESMEIGQKWGQELAEKAFAPMQNETSAEKALKTLVDAECNFMKADYDNDGKDFCYNLNLLHNQVDAARNPVMLIPKPLAMGSSSGYKFAELSNYDAAGGDDCKFGFAYCAVPEGYGKSGRRTYIVNHTGAIYFKDTAGKPPTTWPKDPDKEGWKILGE